MDKITVTRERDSRYVSDQSLIRYASLCVGRESLFPTALLIPALCQRTLRISADMHIRQGTWLLRLGLLSPRSYKD